MLKACVVEKVLHKQFRDETSEVLGIEDKIERVVTMPTSLENNLPGARVCIRWTLD